MRLLTVLWPALVLSLALLLIPSASAYPGSVAGVLGIADNLIPDGLIAAKSNAIFLPVYSFSAGNLTAHVLDVGQGDSILIQFKGKNILIDGGEREMGPRVASYLRDRGVSKIDLMVATHPHSDHIGGLLEILDKFQVLKVLDSGQPHTSKTYEDFLTRIDRKDIPYQVAEAGQRIDLNPGIDIEVLSPPARRLADDLNQNSVVLRIVYGKVALLLMGDAGVEAEKVIISSGFEVKSDVLKVGHHGSKSATGGSFLKRVDPKVSIISAGLGNPYGHPAPEIIKRLQKSGIQIYRTDLQGTIDVTTDGVAIYVSTQARGGTAKAAAVRQKAEA
ncbi:MAG TPA: MBL fold metallo-hydrolase [Methanotrichaceae archaeon]|nr:MBL fold metallo-hydrolase [Methanotrichaceae archaeon]